MTGSIDGAGRRAEQIEARGDAPRRAGCSHISRQHGGHARTFQPFRVGEGDGGVRLRIEIHE